ncbi:MAG: hypothetical protein JNK78_14230 [Planctomycetes bacterium]|nr:hypothetical protein [Planctomycetota bacterium]
MNTRSLVLLANATLTAAALAQASPDFLVTYSQPQQTLSGSAGTVLQFLYPNEIAHLEWSNGPCASMSAEKWAPRTCFQTMAGDENSDGLFWNPTLFGKIDALVDVPVAGSPIGALANARTVFWSPSVDMGIGVSGGPGLRAGDVGRIIRNTAFQDGQVEYYMRREDFNSALGLPLNTVIDVDAIAWAPGMGVYFSLDQDVFAFPACGPTIIRDGDIICVPEPMLTYTWDMRIQSVTPNSAHVVYTEAQVDAMVANAGVADRFGNCIPNAVDLESLEIDWNAQAAVIPGCTGLVVHRPHFIFSTETMTGAGLLTTIGGGSIYNATCAPAATPCGGGPTLGWQMGIQPVNAALGAPSFVNAITFTRSVRYSMEPQVHVATNPIGGLPFGWQNVDISSPFPFNIIVWTTAPVGVNTVAQSFANPFWMLTHPDFYPMPTIWTSCLTAGGFATWPMLALPPGFTGNVVFQAVGFSTFGSIEFSTPMTLEIQ